MKRFTVEEINLMCCFDTTSRIRLIAEMKSLPLDGLDEEMTELLYRTAQKLNGLSDAEFEALNVAADSLIEDDKEDDYARIGW